MTRPLCFVLMPFGRKPDGAGGTVDFDAVYRELFAPAIEESGLQPLRAGEEQSGGISRKPMFERLILSEYAVADLTTADANVFYELGVRHAVRPGKTVLAFAEGARPPVDAAPERALRYRLTPAGEPVDEAATRRALAERLAEAREAQTDSLIFQLVDGRPEPQLEREKTDLFRDRVPYPAAAKERLALARDEGVEALRALERELEPIADAETGVVIDLLLSYRAVRAWGEMIALVEKMSPPLASAAMVQEQLGLALNRSGQAASAERVLEDVIARRGPSSETYSILGRVYKDEWAAARRHGEREPARRLLDRAIEAYVGGFEADWRDAYPGVNALTLMEIRDPPDPRREQLLPVVAYALERRLTAREPDYWDHATRLELAVLALDRASAEAALEAALASVREVWEPESTANNLRLVREARAERREPVGWADALEQALRERAGG